MKVFKHKTLSYEIHQRGIDIEWYDVILNGENRGMVMSLGEALRRVFVLQGLTPNVDEFVTIDDFIESVI